MTAFIALLRAVNVGGTGKLSMSDLKAMCEAAGFAKVATYIASGNVVFESGWSRPAQVKSALEARLEAYAGKRVGVVVRTSAPDGRRSGRKSVPSRAAEIERWPSFSTSRRGAERWTMSPAGTAKRSGWGRGRSTFITEPAWLDPD